MAAEEVVVSVPVAGVSVPVVGEEVVVLVPVAEEEVVVSVPVVVRVAGVLFFDNKYHCYNLKDCLDTMHLE